MKIKTTLTTFSAIFALAIIAVSAFSQNNGLTVAAPDAASGFSTFSTPQNMGATINSADNDLLPVPAPSGLSLYFMSNRAGGQGGNDIYVSQRATLSSAWGAPQNLGAVLNTSGDDGLTGFSPDGREMFLQSTRPGGQGGQDIYLSTRTDPNNDFGWTAPVNLGAVINAASFDAGGIYFIDPTTGTGSLLFYSDRNGTPLVNFNIYQSTRNADGTFNAPVLVNELNSPAAQIRPSISRDGLEIFISTNRRGPANVFAIHVSTRASVSAPWNPPVYLAGINTAAGSSSHPSLSPDGTVLYFTSTRPGGIGAADLYSATRVAVNRSSTADFDGDGRTDLSVFRPSDGTWYVMQSSSNTFRATQFGTNGDKIVPGDYDGDGRTDFAVFRQVSTSGVWYIMRSSDNSVSGVQWGLATDKPVPGDYDGDGKTDIAVYRNGVWYIVQSSNGQFSTNQFGASGDIPVAAANSQ
ncbi:MAG: FG-GAP-like repeat-containing protein [Acidobacteriota bacterium]|nr:FG-GAP-like repeat-containing protein [Acidobacteriota bacterium]